MFCNVQDLGSNLKYWDFGIVLVIKPVSVVYNAVRHSTAILANAVCMGDTFAILIPVKAPANIKIKPATVRIKPSVNNTSDANQPGSCLVSMFSNFLISPLASWLNFQLSYPQCNVVG